MWQTLKNAWTIDELKKKIMYTFMILVIFRIGSVIPVPYLDTSILKTALQGDAANTIFGYLNVLTGGAFEKATIFAMSISPYINSSIIVNLLTVAIPSWERLSKEGIEGRKKLAQYTRYGTVILGFIQGFGFYSVLRSYGAVTPNNFFTATVIVLTFTAGTAFIMWLGENINEHGIGNGISIILFAGIISSLPSAVISMNGMINAGTLNTFTAALIVLLALILVAFVVYVSNAERRIPVQYAKRVVGRKMYGGQSTHIPLKVNMTGVIPIIFASSITTFPATLFMVFRPQAGGFWATVEKAVQPGSFSYAIVYFILIIFFNYFYAAIQFNPIEMSNNLKKNGGFIPGIRPGRPTSDYLTKILAKITMLGALFLGIMAIIPIGLSYGLGINLYLGGTSLLIVVGVALDTVKQLESQMLMRHYKGFLE
jgi:preprotein translocase subunit SecY